MLLTRTHYKCTKCEAEDYVDTFDNDPAPITINCYKCKAGYHLSIDEMIASKRGMFPTGPGTPWDNTTHPPVVEECTHG